MSNYLIKLTPVGKFFFGGDMTFSVGTKDLPKEWYKRPSEERKRIEDQVRFNTRYASYIIKSEKFPQQTSLLGMLRFLLLQNSDLFDGVKIKDGTSEQVKALIGKKSFMAGEKGEFGCIKKLSPCFLMKEDQIITRLPLDYGLKEVSLNRHDNHHQYYNSKVVDLSTIKIEDDGKTKDFTAKDGDVSEKYGYGCVVMEEKDIFIEDLRIGINRNIETGHTEDNALFKQVNYRLADDFCFALYAQIDEKLPYSSGTCFASYTKKMVSLGADNSQFVIEIIPLENKDSEELPVVSLPRTKVKLDAGRKKVVLTSPAFVDDSTVERSYYHIATTIPFKHMETNTGLSSYHRLSGIQHSKKVELFQTGSVFYFKSEKDASDFAGILKNRADYYQIGYNHCQVTD